MFVAGSLGRAYEAKLSNGWQVDPAQQTAVTAMNRVLTALASARPQPVKGLYLHGPVGRGKTQLLNMFMEHVDPAKARRTHMHSFMSEIHQRLFEIKSGDPVIAIARQMAEAHRVLGFDEFYVSNIGDGMLLGRLFQHLFQRGVVVVATSNWPMDELYPDGRNRKSLLPFIRILERNMQSIDLGDGEDYRQSDENHWPLYLVRPARSSTPPELARLFEEYAEPGETGPPAGIQAKAFRGRCGWYHFEELCERPLGRREYLDSRAGRRNADHRRHPGDATGAGGVGLAVRHPDRPVLRAPASCHCLGRRVPGGALPQRPRSNRVQPGDLPASRDAVVVAGAA